MKEKSRPSPIITLALIGGCVVLIFLAVWFRRELQAAVLAGHAFLSDRDAVQHFIASYSGWAPVVFVLFQFLQVIVAPVPGEATGFIGGYLFGPFTGFLFSSIGLALGSWVNFMAGRFLGEKYIRKLISPKLIDRFEPVLKRQGLFILLVLFIFPGFPKDYLCLFLGVTTLPIKTFLVIAAFGRMPGTLMLSLQGAYVFERQYGMFVIIFGISMLVVYLLYRSRERLYRYLEGWNDKSLD